MTAPKARDYSTEGSWGRSRTYLRRLANFIQRRTELVACRTKLQTTLPSLRHFPATVRSPELVAWRRARRSCLCTRLRCAPEPPRRRGRAATRGAWGSATPAANHPVLVQIMERKAARWTRRPKFLGRWGHPWGPRLLVLCPRPVGAPSTHDALPGPGA